MLTTLEKPYLDAAALSLDDWLDLVLKPPHERRHSFIDYAFPSTTHRNEFVESISDRSEKEIKDLLRCFLIRGGSLGADELTWAGLRMTGRLRDALQDIEHIKRLVNPERHTWEGNTWILDLLPLWPQMAIDAIGAYVSAHGQFMPDGRWDGHTDAMAIIRARYLEAEHPQDVLLGLSSRNFELYIAALYSKMDYVVTVTPPSRDGGYDMVAIQREHGRAERILIECKRHVTPVGVRALRMLRGVVERHGTTKGVLVTTTTFTRDAIREAKESSRIELIDYRALNRLLNRYIAPTWAEDIDRDVLDAQRRFGQRLAA